MKNICLLSGLLIMANNAFAQPIITMANSAPVPGESFMTHFAPWQSEGPSGANQTWDFSMLVPDSSKTFNWVDPAMTPNGTSFPTADVAQEDPGAGFVYFDYANGDMEYIGADANGLLVEQTDPEINLKFPCTFGTTWTDTQAGTIPFGGTRSGVTDGNADAYGTLILPWGTVNDVLRVNLSQVYTDNIVITIDYDFDFYMYYKEGVSSPLLIVADLLVTPSLGPASNSKYIQYADQSVLGLEERLENLGSIRIYPIPATENATLEFSLRSAETISLEVFDLSGRTMIQELLGNLQAGPHIHTLDVSRLKAGSYVLQLSGQNGKSAQRIIVQ